ncbi:AAA family ATPase [Parasedimentitalea marina]|uniref:AAA family ATPase n=1 Tax=Parasedimentitalea marina TaxID=2483033 RepID=A0A3T0N5W6_9RHOB|nr:AAA family ATPase [Parasedimentitalea marina]AZV79397.1 AAA family ATPase [Parasedimentitalea marina]
MQNISDMQRIMIVGGPGGGKSTLAQLLSAQLNLPIIHMDHLFWAPDWVQREKDHVAQLARSAADGPRWIFEGNHSRSWDYRAERAEMIVVLALPRWLRMWRILKRTVRHYGRSRPDMAEGCPERFDLEFLRWSWSYDNHSGRKLLAFGQRWGGGRPVVWLSSPCAVKRFLHSI